MGKNTQINTTIRTQEEIYRHHFLDKNVAFVDRYKFTIPPTDKNQNEEPQVEYFFIYRTQPFVVQSVFPRFGAMVCPVFFGVSPSYPGVFFKIPTMYSSNIGEHVEENAFKNQYKNMKLKSSNINSLQVLLRDNESSKLKALYSPRKLIQDHVAKTSQTILNLPEFVALQRYAKTLQGKWFAPEANLKGKRLEEILKKFPSPESLRLLIDLSEEKANKMTTSNTCFNTNTTMSLDVFFYEVLKPRQRTPFFLTASKASRTQTFNLLMDLKETMERNSLFDEFQGNTVAEVEGLRLK